MKKKKDERREPERKLRERERERERERRREKKETVPIMPGNLPLSFQASFRRRQGTIFALIYLTDFFYEPSSPNGHCRCCTRRWRGAALREMPALF